MRRVLRFVAHGVASYIVAAALIALAEHAYLKRSWRRFVR